MERRGLSLLALGAALISSIATSPPADPAWYVHGWTEVSDGMELREDRVVYAIDLHANEAALGFLGDEAPALPEPGVLQRTPDPLFDAELRVLVDVTDEGIASLVGSETAVEVVLKDRQGRRIERFDGLVPTLDPITFDLSALDAFAHCQVAGPCDHTYLLEVRADRAGTVALDIYAGATIRGPAIDAPREAEIEVRIARMD